MSSRSRIEEEFASHRLQFLVCAAKGFNLDEVRYQGSSPVLTCETETGVRYHDGNGQRIIIEWRSSQLRGFLFPSFALISSGEEHPKSNTATWQCSHRSQKSRLVTNRLA
jgi:hypothetical protein